MHLFDHGFAPLPRPTPRLLAVAVVVAVLAAAAYIAAATAASGIASTLSARETLRYARAVELEAAIAGASARDQVARARCDLLEPRERDDCLADAERVRRMAIRGAAAWSVR